MARGKKKEELSLEEKLERALVPEGEWLYEVPGNWCWVRLGNMVDLHRGVSYKKNEGHSVKCENDCLVMRGGNILEGAIDIDAENIYVDKSLIKPEQYLQENDIVIVASTGSKKVIGRAGISFASYSDVSFGAFLILVRPKEQVCKRYVDYYFQSQIYRERIRSLASGVNINNIRAEYVINSPVPLPPIKEQQCIVEQIESLFAKLDEAKEKIQEIMVSCEIRQASILKDVFNGKLSESWRAENGMHIESWNIISFDDCIDKMQNGLAKRSGKEGKLFGVLRLANLEENNFNTDDLREIKLTEKEQDTYKLNVNDIVMIRVNGSRDNVGRQILVKEEHDWAFCDHIIRMVLKKNIEPAFMIMFSKTDEYRYYIEKHMVSSAGQNTISRKGLAELYVPVPTISEQLYLIQIVNGMIQKEIIIKENAKSVLEKIDLIKKSILAKAFRGELGTNNPEEESVIEILKTILAET